MTVWVTGANGQVGRCLADVVSASGRDGYLFLSRDALDITSEAAVADLAQRTPPSCIVNLAAYTRVDKAESEPELAMRVNGTAVRYLAEAAQRHGAPLIQVSTDYVFNGAQAEPYVEGDPVDPLNVYGHTKLAGERSASHHCDRHVIVRTSWVFSEYGENFVRTMLRLGRERDSLSVVGDQFGGPTYAGDIARFMIDLVERSTNGEAESGVCHFAGRPFVSWYEFAGEVLEAARLAGLLDRPPALQSITSDMYPTAAKRPRNSRLASGGGGCLADNVGPDWRAALSAVVSRIGSR